MPERIPRRDFLKRLLAGSGAMFIAFSPLKVFAAETPAGSPDLTALKRQARELFYQKKYAQAADLYRQIIAQSPASVSGYDGLARVLSAQNQNLEVAELYREALQKNQQTPAFYDRMARAMNDICLGNHKAEKAFCQQYGETFLLEASIALYAQAIALSPGKKYLYEGILDTNKCLEKLNRQLRKQNKFEQSFSAQTQATIANTTLPYLANWEQTRKSRKPAVDPYQASGAIEKARNKVRRQLYTAEEKAQREEHINDRIRNIRSKQLDYFIKSKEDNNTITREALILAKEFPADTQTTAKLRRYYIKRGDYASLMAMYEKVYEKKKDFWTTVLLAEATCRQGWKTDTMKLINQARQLYKDSCSDPSKLESKEKFAYYSGLMLCYFAQRNYGQARKILPEALAAVEPDSGIELNLLLAYAESFSYDKQWKQGMKILDALLSATMEGKIDDDATINSSIQNRNGKPLPPQEQIKVYVAIAKLQQQQQGDSAGLSQTKANILKLDPQNPFAMKL